jgi:hypothetical protein
MQGCPKFLMDVKTKGIAHCLMSLHCAQSGNDFEGVECGLLMLAKTWKIDWISRIYEHVKGHQNVRHQSTHVSSQPCQPYINNFLCWS